MTTEEFQTYISRRRFEDTFITSHLELNKGNKEAVIQTILSLTVSETGITESEARTILLNKFQTLN